MLPWEPQDIKFSLGTPKSHIGKTWNFAKLTHGPSNSYHRVTVLCTSMWAKPYTTLLMQYCGHSSTERLTTQAQHSIEKASVLTEATCTLYTLLHNTVHAIFPSLFPPNFYSLLHSFVYVCMHIQSELFLLPLFFSRLSVVCVSR